VCSTADLDCKLNDRKGKHNHIYAISTGHPSSSAVDADIEIHDDVGYFSIDFDKVTKTETPASPKNPSKPKEHIPSPDMPLTPFQRLILAHGLFGSIGFVVCLPLGAILARWLRTYTSAWMKGHWMIQAVIGRLKSFALGAILI
jgi:hypothetical protein